MKRGTDTIRKTRLVLAYYIYNNETNLEDFLTTEELPQSRSERKWFIKMLLLGPLSISKSTGEMKMDKKWCEFYLAEKIRENLIPKDQNDYYESVKFKLCVKLANKPLSLEETKKLDFISEIPEGWFEEMYKDIYGKQLFLRDKKLTIKNYWVRENLKNKKCQN